MATTKKTTATKKTTTKKAAAAEAKVVTEKATTKTTAAKSAASKKKYIYAFFNCDDNKSAASMNVHYNNEAFPDTVAGRKALLKKVEEECAAGRINVADKSFVEEAIIKGEPVDASSNLQYASIERLVLVG